MDTFIEHLLCTRLGPSMEDCAGYKCSFQSQRAGNASVEKILVASNRKLKIK